MGGFRSKRGARAHSDTENLRKGFDVRNIATIVFFYGKRLWRRSPQHTLNLIRKSPRVYLHQN
jgi:hypothetical protein